MMTDKKAALTALEEKVEDLQRRVAKLESGVSAQLCITDNEGKSQIVLALTADHEPYIAFLDESSTVRLSFCIAGGEPRVLLNDASGMIRCTVSTDDGRPSIVLYDASGEVVRGVGCDGVIGF
jgi:hypothetical protein